MKLVSGFKIKKSFKFAISSSLLIANLLTLGISIFPSTAHAYITDGLVSFWALNESSGSRVDTIGSNDLTITGGAVTDAVGKVGSSTQFQSGSSGYLSVDNNSSFNTSGGDFSLSVWAYLDNKTGTQVFASKYGGGGYAIYYEPGSSAFMFSTYAGNGVTAGTDLGDPSTGTWYHIVGVHDSVANANTIRINDQYQDVSTSVVDQADTSGPFTIGAFGAAGQYIANGRVDAVGFWNRKLTADEITELYGSGSGVELTADITSPVISDIDTSSEDEEATITWTTDEAATSRVVYGVTASLGTTTATTDTSPRVTSHSVTLQNLLACTDYNFAVVSYDSASNISTSTTSSFLTTGCSGEAVPTAATSTSITSASGGETSVADSGKTFTVTAPSGATATSSSYVIQVKAVSSDTVLASIGRPSSSLSKVGGTVFDVKAIIDNGSILDSFGADITIEYEYTDSEISGIDESSLRLYHYSDGSWSGLNNCSINTSANSISCTTDSFSIFGLFGSASESVSGPRSAGTYFGCKDPKALNFESYSSHRQDLCKYGYTGANTAYITTNSTSSKNFNLVKARDLKLNMTGEDVRALQKFLNNKGFMVAKSGIGSIGNETVKFGGLTRSALIRFQKANNISPAIGYFGPITRAKAKSLGY